MELEPAGRRLVAKSGNFVTELIQKLSDSPAPGLLPPSAPAQASVQSSSLGSRKDKVPNILESG